MKSNKAMGYIPSILIIVIVALLVASSVYFIRIKLNEEYIETLKTNMLLIEWKAREYVDTKKASKEEIVYIGTKVSEMRENQLISNIINDNVISEDEYEKYYVLTDDNLQELNLEVTNEEGSYYIINYDTYEVIITKGCIYKEGETLYKLSDIKRGEKVKVEEKITEADEAEEKEENENDTEGE